MKFQTYIDRYEDAMADYTKDKSRENTDNLYRWERLLRKKILANPHHPLASYTMGPSPMIYYCDMVWTPPKSTKLHMSSLYGQMKYNINQSFSVPIKMTVA
jgi:hypothetical protein